MHEVSLVRNVFNTLQAEFSKEEIQNIKSIKLTVGVLSNVEPTLMQNAFDAVIATDHPEFSTSKLDITKLDIKVHCDLCNQDSEVTNYTFVCQHCKQPTNNIVQGNELMINGVEFYDESDIG
jgi:hydrogenase nickel incorporation protein HypA/HybF